MSEGRTIDKISFKVNIPIIVTIIVGTCTIYGIFASIRTDIQLLSAKLDNHSKEEVAMVATIKSVQDKNENQDKTIAEIDRRVYVLEKYK